MWAAIFWFVIAWRLGYLSLLDPDEAHYAQLTREMLGANNWLVPLLDGVPFIDKPVFFHWLQGASMRWLGETELAARVPSALAAVALVWTTRWAGARMFGAAIGEWGALMLATTPMTFALGRIGMLDMVYTAFLFGAVACLIVAAIERRRGLEYGGYALLSLAFMTKGPVALVLTGVFVVLAIGAARRTRQAIARLHWIRGFALVVLAASPWFIWMWARFGDQFVREYLIVGNLFYFTQPASFSTRLTGYGFYLRTFTAGFFPWSLLLVGYLVDAARRWRKQETPTPEILLWLWLLVVVGFFSSARFRLDHYIFPAAPAVCLLAARGLSRAAEDRKALWTAGATAVVAVGLLIGGAVLGVALGDIDLRAGAAAQLLPAVLCLGGAVVAVLLVRARGVSRAAFGVLVATMIAVYATADLVAFPVLNASTPTKPLGRWIAAHSHDDGPIGLFKLEDWRASSRFYGGRRAVRLDDGSDLHAFLTHYPEAFVLIKSEDAARLRRLGVQLSEVAGEPAIVGRKSGRYFNRQVWGKLVVVTGRGRKPSEI